jgi:uncharacterized protein YcfL
MSKYLTVGVILAVTLVAVAACKSKTEASDITTPSIDSSVPEPDMNAEAIETVQTDVPTPEPEAMAAPAAAPVQSLGASSSGLGR